MHRVWIAQERQAWLDIKPPFGIVVYGNPAGGTLSTVLTTSNVIVNLDRTADPGLATVSIRGVNLGIGAMGSFTLINRPSVTMSYAGYCF